MSVDRWPRDRKLAPTRPAAPSVSSLASRRSVGSTPSAIDEETQLRRASSSSGSLSTISGSADMPPMSGRDFKAEAPTALGPHERVFGQNNQSGDRFAHQRHIRQEWRGPQGQHQQHPAIHQQRQQRQLVQSRLGQQNAPSFTDNNRMNKMQAWAPPPQPPRLHAATAHGGTSTWGNVDMYSDDVVNSVSRVRRCSTPTGSPAVYGTIVKCKVW